MIGNRTRLMLVAGPLGLICAPLALGGCIDRSATGAGARGAIEIATLPGVTFQTVLGGMHVGAENNGGGAVNATASTAQTSQTFTLLDINGGTLNSGDSVFIRAGNGQYLQALNGGGSTLNAASNNQLAWETFKIVRQSGDGAVNNGDVVGLRCFSGAWISAEGGGSGPVFAYGGAFGAWEQFNIAGLSATDVPPPTPTPPVLPPGSATTVRDVNFRNNADALIDMESFTNARWGLPDGRIQWADLGPTRGGGCE